MIENAHVETASFIWLIVGAVLWIAVPIVSICLSNPFFQFPERCINRGFRLQKLYLIVLI